MSILITRQEIEKKKASLQDELRKRKVYKAHLRIKSVSIPNSGIARMQEDPRVFKRKESYISYIKYKRQAHGSSSLHCRYVFHAIITFLIKTFHLPMQSHVYPRNTSICTGKGCDQKEDSIWCMHLYLNCHVLLLTQFHATSPKATSYGIDETRRKTAFGACVCTQDCQMQLLHNFMQLVQSQQAMALTNR